MRKLIEMMHVTLGAEIGSPHLWGFPYLDEEHMAYLVRWVHQRQISIRKNDVWSRTYRKAKTFVADADVEKESSNRPFLAER